MTTPKRATSRRKRYWAIFFRDTGEAYYIIHRSRASASHELAHFDYPDNGYVARIELREVRTGKGKRCANTPP